MTETLFARANPPRAWLAGRDPRLRILLALGFALAAASLRAPPVQGLGLALALALAIAAGVPPRLLARRLLALEGLLFAVVALVPFSVPGAPLLTVGGATATREGLALALTILLRATTVALTLLALLGTLEPVRLGQALARLRLPGKLTTQFYLTLRYIDVMYAEYRRLRLAMRARAFVARSDRHGWRSLGWLIGMLLVRGLKRSHRILAAMRCRAFAGRLPVLDDSEWRAADSGYAAFGLLLAALLLGLDRLA